MMESARVKLDKWLMAQIEACEKEASELKKQQGEIEKRLNEVKKNADSFRSYLRLTRSMDATSGQDKRKLESDGLPELTTSTDSSGRVNANPNAVYGKFRIPADKDDSSERRPKDLLKPEYATMTLLEVAQSILDTQKRIMGIDDIAKLAFTINYGDEYDRAKSSLAAELRRGAKDGRWRQPERGKFMSLDGDPFLNERPPKDPHPSILDRLWREQDID